MAFAALPRFRPLVGSMTTPSTLQPMRSHSTTRDLYSHSAVSWKNLSLPTTWDKFRKNKDNYTYPQRTYIDNIYGDAFLAGNKITVEKMTCISLSSFPYSTKERVIFSCNTESTLFCITKNEDNNQINFYSGNRVKRF